MSFYLLRDGNRYSIRPERRLENGNVGTDERRRSNIGTRVDYDVSAEVQHLIRNSLELFQNMLDSRHLLRKKLRELLLLSVSYVLVLYFDYHLIVQRIGPVVSNKEESVNNLPSHVGAVTTVLALFVGLFLLADYAREYNHMYYLRERFMVLDIELRLYVRNTLMQIDALLYNTLHRKSRWYREVLEGPAQIELAMLYIVGLGSFVSALFAAYMVASKMDGAWKGVIAVISLLIAIAAGFVGYSLKVMSERNSELFAIQRGDVAKAVSTRRSNLSEYFKLRISELEKYHESLLSRE